MRRPSAGVERSRRNRELLDTYTAAVLHQDQVLFETLLLSRDIPFAYVPDAPSAADSVKWHDCAGFCHGMFDGPPFTQTFHDVAIRQHGALADVAPVYVYTDATGTHPSWKKMQFIKVVGQ